MKTWHHFHTIALFWFHFFSDFDLSLIDTWVNEEKNSSYTSILLETVVHIQ